jgi:hypothetical protein
MKRYRWWLLIALLGSILAGLVAGPRMLAAQDPFVSVTAYEVSVPVGDTRRFMTTPSWMGLSWEGRWPVANRVSGGVMIGINEFSDRSTGTTNFPSGAATGPQFRYLLSLPVLATGYVYPFANDRHRVYLGGGAGVTRIEQLFQLGDRQLGNAAWHFVVAPEVGAEIHSIGGDYVGVLSVRYNAPLAMGDYLGGGSRSFRHFTIRLGMGYEIGEDH